MEKFNEDKFKYHLIHHYHDYFLDKSLKLNSLANLSCISYNPKMEYIFKKINYSLEFKKMRGRYDQQNMKELIKRKLENNINQIKEKEYKKKMQKLEKIKRSIKISHKELLNENENNKIDDKLKRHNSLNEILFENRNINLILLKNKIPEKFINENNDEIINESRNFKRNLFKRTKTTNNINFSFRFKKNLIEEKDDKILEKINISNNSEDNTLLSLSNHNKAICDKKKENSLNSNETDINCANNSSRNESFKKINVGKKKDIFSYKNYKKKRKNNFGIKNKINKKNILPLIIIF